MFVINGNKQWVTSGKVAEFAIVMAITDRTKQRQNLSGILVDLATPGVNVGRAEDLVGIRGHGHRVDKLHQLPGAGRGFDWGGRGGG